MKRIISTLLAGFFVVGCAVAQESSVTPEPGESAVRQALKRIVPNAEPDSVAPSQLSGFFEVVFGPDLLYISSDGRYLIQGEVFDLNTNENLTEAKKAGGRREIMKQIPLEEMITFAPEETKYNITVFTDIDCTYCRRLHREIKDYTDRGIAVHYVFSPRSQKSMVKAVNVWCADDQKEAMSRAKAGEILPDKSCDNPVAQHARVAQEMGISGTPMIVLDSGQVISGYVPADRLMPILTAP